MGFVDLTGKSFGRLTVIKLQEKKQLYYKGKKRGFAYYWLCKCTCGNTKIIRNDALVKNITLSCGCIQKEFVKEYVIKNNITHNLSYHHLYKLYHLMRARCYNPNTASYINYGGRGIKVCDEWLNDFKTFYDWAIDNGYKKGLSIDRIDVNSNYSPDNCRWVTQKEQQNNRRNNHYITFNNETHTIAEWEQNLNFKRGTISARINHYKWNIEKALTTPVLNKKI